MTRLAAAWLLFATLITAAVFTAATARTQTLTICDALTTGTNTIGDVMRVVVDLADQNDLTVLQASRVVATTVRDDCPDHAAIVNRLIARLPELIGGVAV